MSRVRLVGPLAAAATCLAALPAMASEAYTTRIEPRVFYGATVTLEEGVRVFRPLPPHKHVIINPDSKAPVSLSFSESVEKSYNYFYDEASGAPQAPAAGAGGVPFGFGHDGLKNGHKEPQLGAFPPIKKKHAD